MCVLPFLGEVQKMNALPPLGTRHESSASDIYFSVSRFVSTNSHQIPVLPSCPTLPSTITKHPQNWSFFINVWWIKTCCSLTRGAKHIFGLVLYAWASDGHTVRTRQIKRAGWTEKDEFHAPLMVFFWPSQSSSERLLKRYNLALHSKYGYSPRWSVLLNLCIHPGGRPNKFSTHTQPASFKFRAVKF